MECISIKRRNECQYISFPFRALEHFTLQSESKIERNQMYAMQFPEIITSAALLCVRLVVWSVGRSVIG